MKTTGLLRPVASHNGKTTAWGFTVPMHIAKWLPKDQVYRIEIVEEGVLFRAVDTAEEPVPELPDWTKREK